MEMRENCLHVSLVKHSCHNENALQMFVLQINDGAVEFYTSLVFALGGMYTALMMIVVNSLGRENDLQFKSQKLYV